MAHEHPPRPRADRRAGLKTGIVTRIAPTARREPSLCYRGGALLVTIERPARYAYHVGCPRVWAEPHPREPTVSIKRSDSREHTSVGGDVHKDSITSAVLEPGRGMPSLDRCFHDEASIRCFVLTALTEN